MDGYIAEIRMFGGNFAPRSWAFCQGQILSIAQNTALFALLGTTFGGNGQTTFALPDLRGRAAVGTGAGPGLPSINLGQMAGVESITLTTSNMAAHTHTINGTAFLPASGEDGHKASPVNNFPAVNGDNIYTSTSDSSKMAPAVLNLTVGTAGSSQPFSNIKPYLAINYVICMEGIFPSRN